MGRQHIIQVKMMENLARAAPQDQWDGAQCFSQPKIWERVRPRAGDDLRGNLTGKELDEI